MATVYGRVYEMPRHSGGGFPPKLSWIDTGIAFRIHDVSGVFAGLKHDDDSDIENGMYCIISQHELELRSGPESMVTYERELHLTQNRQKGEMVIKEGSRYTMIKFDPRKARDDKMALMEFFRKNLGIKFR